MTEKGHHNEGGKTSFRWVDGDKLFKEISLIPGNTFLDLGCGKGDYTLAVAQILGRDSEIIGIDQWAEGIDILTTEAKNQGFPNIKAYTGDISQELPVKSSSVDICLMSAVLHGLVKNERVEGTLKELKRVMKPRGQLAVIEWKKKEGPPGPSISTRLSEKEVEDLLNPVGFIKKRMTSVGEYFDLMVFLYIGA
jgi:ubiquinone/menaquinone biosynthesis C-methylase UbiE